MTGTVTRTSTTTQRAPRSRKHPRPQWPGVFLCRGCFCGEARRRLGNAVAGNRWIYRHSVTQLLRGALRNCSGGRRVFRGALNLSALDCRGAENRSGGAANTPLEEQFALRLAETAPDAVGLTDGKGVGPALGDHGAATAHLLGSHLPVCAGASALAVGVEEHRGFGSPAQAGHLPIPDIGVRPG